MPTTATVRRTPRRSRSGDRCNQHHRRGVVHRPAPGRKKRHGDEAPSSGPTFRAARKALRISAAIAASSLVAFHFVTRGLKCSPSFRWPIHVLSRGGPRGNGGDARVRSLSERLKLSRMVSALSALTGCEAQSPQRSKSQPREQRRGGVCRVKWRSQPSQTQGTGAWCGFSSCPCGQRPPANPDITSSSSAHNDRSNCASAM
mmetsp:Transcript_35430/g.97821  ORF Transcript_35430/g.97821 Transcript_35430/m.97821 type:complete len:202 (+) Transcript_35430:252-857(+)